MPTTATGTRERAGVTDTIVLTVPAEEPYRGVATLVLGGIGSRLDLPFERMDDMQLALLSLLDAADGHELSMEVEVGVEEVSVSVGPLAEGSGSDEALRRVLSPLVDAVEPHRREGAEWVTLRLARSRAGSPDPA